MKVRYFSLKTIVLLIVVFITTYNYIIELKLPKTYRTDLKRNCSIYTGLEKSTADPLFCKRMQILFPRTCDKTTYDLRIIAIVFDRSQSLLRLLHSFNEAVYDGDSVKLEVWIDRSARGYLDNATVKAANTFSFKHGVYEVIEHLEHVGLFGQWISTWRPANDSSEIAVICEDDLTVSKYFYRYLKLVHRKYDHFPKINGFALQGSSLKHHINDTSPLLGPNGSLVFLYPVIGSWGFSPSRDNWLHFQKWFTSVCNKRNLDLYIPNSIMSRWYNDFKKSGKHDGLWTIWHVYHAYINSEFTLYTNIPGHIGFSTNWREKGLHFIKYEGKTNELVQHWMQEFEDLPTTPKCVDIAGKLVK